MKKIKPIKFRNKRHVEIEIEKISDARNYVSLPIVRIAACLLSLWKWKQSEYILAKDDYTLGADGYNCGLCKLVGCIPRHRDCPIDDKHGSACGNGDSPFSDACLGDKQPLVEALTIATAKEITREAIKQSTESITKELEELKKIFEV